MDREKEGESRFRVRSKTIYHKEKCDIGSEEIMKYSAGDIANLLGISIVAVRNYEKYGLVDPQRDEQNNYRKYEPIDLNVIRRARSYMSYGFSHQEAAEIMLGTDLEGMAQALKNKEKDIEKQLQFDYQLLQFTRKHAQYLHRISASEYKCTVEMSPAFYGLIYREGIRFLQDDALQKKTKIWNDIRPFAETFVIFKKQCFFNHRTQGLSGICIDEDFASFFGIEQDEYVQYYPSRKTIHTIVPHGYEPEIDYSRFAFDYVLDWADQNGLSIADDAFGRVLHTSKESGEWRHYMEVWVPIE